MVKRCCGSYQGLFLKVSSLSAIMQKSQMRAQIHRLRDQLFELGMIICIYVEMAAIFQETHQKARVYETWQKYVVK